MKLSIPIEVRRKKPKGLGRERDAQAGALFEPQTFLSDNVLHDGIGPEGDHIACTGLEDSGGLEFLLGAGVTALASQLEKGFLPARGRADRKLCRIGNYDMGFVFWQGDAHAEKLLGLLEGSEAQRDAAMVIGDGGL